jgi:hypothetical protein
VQLVHVAGEVHQRRFASGGDQAAAPEAALAGGADVNAFFAAGRPSSTRWRAGFEGPLPGAADPQ